MDPLLCDHCRFEIPADWQHCPHCCHELKAVNVRMADASAERAALQKRYDAAVMDARGRGCEPVLSAFETSMGQTQAVLACRVAKLLPIVNASVQLFATYYDLADLQFLSMPCAGPIDWTKRRPQAEIELLGSHKHINLLHYACLSADGRSLPHYGECAVLLREHMIAHRASLLQENSAVAYHRDHEFPAGTRSTWNDRGRLCVAKLANRITASTQSEEFSRLLLNPGATPVEDEFVEVQILGEMSLRTFERITVSPKPGAKSSASKRPRQRRGTSEEAILKDYCNRAGVICELI